MNPPSIESFHTILYCRKWEACVHFYRRVLQFKEGAGRKGFVEFQVAPGSHIGLLELAKEDKRRMPNDSVVLTLRVGDVDGLHKVLSERCKDISGIQPHPWGARLFTLRDPEGRRLEFWTLYNHSIRAKASLPIAPTRTPPP